MTVDQCYHQLLSIRRRQGTRYPLVRVDCASSTYRGRLSHTDSDPEHRRNPGSPYGVLVLEGLGLARAPETIVQIANINDNGIQSLDGFQS
jgi:hypothetical protein